MKEYFKVLKTVEKNDCNIAIIAHNNGIDQEMDYIVSIYYYDSGDESDIYESTNYKKAYAYFNKYISEHN